MTGAARTRGAEQRRAATAAQRLGRVLVLTDRHQAAVSLAEVVAAAVDAGARGVVLREKDLPDAERRALVAQLAPIVHGAGGVLLSAGTYVAGTDGVHQPSDGGPHASTSDAITGRSCHDSDELRAGEAASVDYVTVSPVFASASKPGYGPALGVDGLAALVAATTVPVYALGGVDTPEVVTACRSAGAHGVAVMGAIMRARRPGPLVAELLAAAEVDPA